MRPFIENQVLNGHNKIDFPGRVVVYFSQRTETKFREEMSTIFLRENEFLSNSLIYLIIS